MPVSLKKCTTQIGPPIPFLYLKRIKFGGCELIIPILIRHAKKRSLRASMDWSGCGLHSWLQPFKFSRLLLWVTSDSPQGRRPNQDILHYSIWWILLYSYALRTQKRRRNLPARYGTVSAFIAWAQHWRIRWWCGQKDSGRWVTHLWPGRDLRQPKKIQNEAEPWEVYVAPWFSQGNETLENYLYK
jgi:hypothetical protein